MWGLNLSFLLVFGLLLRNAATELFVNEPGVHYPRVVTPFNANEAMPDIRFDLNVPTIGWFVVLLSSILGIGMGVITAAGLLRRTTSKVKYHFAVMTALFVLQVVTMLILIYDFFSNAGSFG